MAVVGRIPAGLVPWIAAVPSVLSILLAYGLAVQAGHVPAFLPAISQCGAEAPERFVLRLGMLPACVMMSFHWFVIVAYLRRLEEEPCGYKDAVYSPEPKRHSSCFCCCLCCCCECWRVLDWLALRAGVAGCLGLLVSLAVLESDGTTPQKLHGALAEFFFLANLTAHVCVVVKLYKLRHNRGDGPPWFSMAFKTCVLVMEWVALLFAAYSSFTKMGDVYWHICEWAGAFLVIGFNLSFAWDYHRRFYVDSLFDPSHLSDETWSGEMIRYALPAAKMR